jgi:hypothetical protein
MIDIFSLFSHLPIPTTHIGYNIQEVHYNPSQLIVSGDDFINESSSILNES